MGDTNNSSHAVQLHRDELLGPIILLRHATSEANAAGTTAGWLDVDLTPDGHDESLRIAARLQSLRLRPDRVHVSALRRARTTSDIVRRSLQIPDSALATTWRLNERHAGAFEGLTRNEMIERFGRAPMRAWKRSLTTRPALLEGSDPRHPHHDPLYRDVDRGLLPAGESNLDVLDRLLPYWDGPVMDDVRQRRRVLVVTHEQVIRLLLWHLRGRPEPLLLEDRVANASAKVLWLTPVDGRLGDVTDVDLTVGDQSST